MDNNETKQKAVCVWETEHMWLRIKCVSICQSTKWIHVLLILTRAVVFLHAKTSLIYTFFSPSPGNVVLVKHFSCQDILLVWCYFFCEIVLVTCRCAAWRNMISNSNTPTRGSVALVSHFSTSAPRSFQQERENFFSFLRRYLKSICRSWRAQL